MRAFISKKKASTATPPCPTAPDGSICLRTLKSGPMPHPAKLLRPATPSDQAFLLEVYMSTRWEETLQMPWSDQQRRAFLRQQHEAQTRDWALRYPRLERSVIVAQGKPAGRLFLNHDATASDVRVVDIALLPTWRGQSLGTQVLREVLAGADARGWTVSLQVFPESRARALYLRLGFAPLRMAGDRLCMQRPALQPPLSKSHQLSPVSGFPEPLLP